MISKVLNVFKAIKRKYYTFRVKRVSASCGNDLTVNAYSYITPKTSLGNNVNFNGMKIQGTANVISKGVVIEDNVWLGNRVIVLPGVTIGEGAIIQAGSVVVNDIPKYAIAGGHPAKVFSSRDKDHYEKLKKEGKFH